MWGGGFHMCLKRGNWSITLAFLGHSPSTAPSSSKLASQRIHLKVLTLYQIHSHTQSARVEPGSQHASAALITRETETGGTLRPAAYPV